MDENLARILKPSGSYKLQPNFYPQAYSPDRPPIPPPLWINQRDTSELPHDHLNLATVKTIMDRGERMPPSGIQRAKPGMRMPQRCT